MLTLYIAIYLYHSLKYLSNLGDNINVTENYQNKSFFNRYVLL